MQNQFLEKTTKTTLVNDMHDEYLQVSPFYPNWI